MSRSRLHLLSFFGFYENFSYLQLNVGVMPHWHQHWMTDWLLDCPPPSPLTLLLCLFPPSQPFNAFGQNCLSLYDFVLWIVFLNSCHDDICCCPIFFPKSLLVICLMLVVRELFGHVWSNMSVVSYDSCVMTAFVFSTSSAQLYQHRQILNVGHL